MKRYGALGSFAAILLGVGALQGCQSTQIKRIEAVASDDVAAVDSFVTKAVNAAADHLPPGTYTIGVSGPAGISANVSYTKAPPAAPKGQ